MFAGVGRGMDNNNNNEDWQLPLKLRIFMVRIIMLLLVLATWRNNGKTVHKYFTSIADTTSTRFLTTAVEDNPNEHQQQQQEEEQDSATSTSWTPLSASQSAAAAAATTTTDRQRSERQEPTPASPLSATIATAERPYVVVHVGPGKTGTTSIQCALRNLRPKLAQDGYTVYLTSSCKTNNNDKSHPKIPQLYQCLREPAGDDNDDSDENGPSRLDKNKNTREQPQQAQRRRLLSARLPSCMEYYHQQWMQLGRRHASSQNLSLSVSPSVILSDEFLFGTPTLRWQSWMQYLAEQLHYRVVIVAYYRNFVERTVSLYSQRLKKVKQWPKHDNKTSSTMLPDVITFVEQKAQEQLLTENHDPYRSIFLPASKKDGHEVEGTRPSNNRRNDVQHTTTTTRTTLQEKLLPQPPRLSADGDASISFRLLNFHEVDDDPATHFICHALPKITTSTTTTLPRDHSSKNINNQDNHGQDNDDDNEEEDDPENHQATTLKTCRHSQSHRPTVKNVNTLAYALDGLAVEVHRQGWLLRRSSIGSSSTQKSNSPFRTLSREQVTAALKNVFRNTNNKEDSSSSSSYLRPEVPLICPTSHQWDVIRNATEIKARAAARYIMATATAINSQNSGDEGDDDDDDGDGRHDRIEEFVSQELARVQEAKESQLLMPFKSWAMRLGNMQFRRH